MWRRGGGISPSPTPTALPAGSAALNLTVTQDANSNYEGPNFKTTASLEKFGPQGYQFLCQVLQSGSTPDNLKGGSFSLILFGAVQKGKTYVFNPAGNVSAAQGGILSADVAYFDGVSPTNLLWEGTPDSYKSGQIIVKSLSSTSVTLQVNNVVLPPRVNATNTKGTVTLNGTITATLPQ